MQQHRAILIHTPIANHDDVVDQVDDSVSGVDAAVRSAMHKMCCQ